MPDDVYFGDPVETEEPVIENDQEPVEEVTEKPAEAAQSSYAKRLSAVNSSIAFTNVRGKSYAEVNQRILAFWGLFPNGRIVTQKTADDGTRCDFTAMVFRDAADEHPAVVGHAFEEKVGNINKTSYIENCETSAVGRALGMLGIGATTAIASADEVIAALEQQDEHKPKEPPVGENFTAHCTSCGTRYTFNDADYYRQFIMSPGCCQNPHWEVE